MLLLLVRLPPVEVNDTGETGQQGGGAVCAEMEGPKDGGGPTGQFHFRPCGGITGRSGGTAVSGRRVTREGGGDDDARLGCTAPAAESGRSEIGMREDEGGIRLIMDGDTGFRRTESISLMLFKKLYEELQ